MEFAFGEENGSDGVVAAYFSTFLVVSARTLAKRGPHNRSQYDWLVVPILLPISLMHCA